MENNVMKISNITLKERREGKRERERERERERNMISNFDRNLYLISVSKRTDIQSRETFS